MFRIMTVIAVCAAILSSFSAADAGSRHKRHHQNYSQGMWSAPVAQRAARVAPRWSGPNECWTDEGYGRFASCSGRSGR